MKEIGSWLEYKEEFFNLKDNGLLRGGELFMSGRAALAYIIAEHGVKELYVPDFFCPDVTKYLENDTTLTITYYPVNEFFDADLKKFEIPKSNHNYPAAFLMVDFFGKRDRSYDKIRFLCAQRGMLFITDRTHSLLNIYEEQEGSIEFASIRKLLAHLPGALMRGVKYDAMRCQLNLTPHLEVLEKKRQYLISHDEKLKPIYLAEMREFESSLAHYDQSFSAFKSDQLASMISSANLSGIASAHRENYKNLLQCLSPKARSIVLDLVFAGNEVPAYMLIQCSSERERNMLMKYLINEDIYIPVHWANGTTRSTVVFSIPIDHRYTVDDMVRVGAALNAFYSTEDN